MSEAANDFHVVTRWRVDGTCGEVADVLGDPLALARWWPAVHLSVDETAAVADASARRFRLRTRGWLPYTLVWDLVIAEHYYPNRLVFDAAGDVVGRGSWTFVQNGPAVDVIIDWRMRAGTRVLRGLSFLLKWIVAADLRWAMAQGEESLRLEVRRRRTLNDAQRAAIPPPPGPVTYAAAAVLGGAAVVAAAAAYLLVRATRAKRRRRVRH